MVSAFSETTSWFQRPMQGQNQTSVKLWQNSCVGLTRWARRVQWQTLHAHDPANFASELREEEGYTEIMKPVVTLTEKKFNALRRECKGICRSCGCTSTPNVEPDAEGYQCVNCYKNEVYGSALALVIGLVEFSG